ncbi:cell division protein FtsL [Halalkalibacter sp. APA_J-10(15)]|uniref:cell division protein FtsL n=1 Tax=unclassified Halalkalibacter TaxID=2893063 RepID=UPI001FF3301D|nr:cell division protein FtsL [Halalkalibacter sp. APA_J-10(15)]MCK0470655.1 cell division protein FtsL [Halalkalibacter sp. APA_J-10(15)]
MVARQTQEQQQGQVQTTKRIKRVRTTVTLGEKLIISIVAITVFVILSVIVHNFATLYSVNKEVQQLETVIAQQQEVNEGLHLQVLELSEPDRILSIAKELGMVLDDNKVKVVQN